MTETPLTALIAEGWAVVPIAPGEKRPSHAEWQSRTFGVDDFRPDDNVGNKNGAPSGRIDVDCDAPQAVRLAGLLLPLTRTHGRPSKPQSHFWYRSDLPTTTFKDVNGEMLIEIRGTGSQTVLPPSVHPSGEVLEWGERPTILQIDPETLKTAVTQVAAASLLARHWPAGSRHLASGHLGGYLARSGWSAPLIERVVRGVAQVAGDDEVEDRARFARETAEKHAKGEPTTGGPGLKDMIGAPVLALLSRWLGRPDDDLVDEMNARHFVVQIGRSMAVGQEPRRPDEGLTFLSYTDFEQKYCNRFVEKKKLGKWWLEHPRRRTYESLVFAPPGARVEVHPDDFNIWQGFVVEPDTSSDPSRRIPRYLTHLHEIVASGNDVYYNYVLDLMADCVQRPGDPPGKALALRGGQGIGKGLALESFGALFGRHFMALNHREQLTGKFNAHLSGKVVVFADEAIWGGHREDVGTLKHLVTQRMIPLQRKGIDTVAERNFMHLFMATNEDWVWPAGNKERRGVILDVNIERPPAYFQALVDEIHSPTFLPALLAVLQARHVDYPRLRQGLDTAALREQMAFAADPVQQWWLMVLEDGAFGNIDGLWPEFVPTSTLYERFTEDMGTTRGAGFSHRGTRMAMTARLMKMLPKSAELVIRRVRQPLAPGVLGDPVATRCLLLPSLGACRKAFDRYTGTDHVWRRIEPEQPDLTEVDDAVV